MKFKEHWTIFVPSFFATHILLALLVSNVLGALGIRTFVNTCFSLQLIVLVQFAQFMFPHIYHCTLATFLVQMS